jgi:hypothetical protein
MSQNYILEIRNKSYRAIITEYTQGVPIIPPYSYQSATIYTTYLAACPNHLSVQCSERSKTRLKSSLNRKSLQRYNTKEMRIICWVFCLKLTY